MGVVFDSLLGRIRWQSGTGGGGAGVWAKKKTITIDNTKVSGTADLVDFWFPLRIAADADLAATAQVDGDDIAFFSSDLTQQLDHRIEVYEATTGRLEAKIRIPTVSYNVDTAIVMVYGNAALSGLEVGAPAGLVLDLPMGLASGAVSPSTAMAESYGRAITIDGNADLVNTVTGHTGSACLDLDGLGDDISLWSVDEMNFGTSTDFTIHCRFRMNVLPNAGHDTYMLWGADDTPTGGANYWSLGVFSSDGVNASFFLWSSAYPGSDNFAWPGAAAGTWYTLTLSRTGTTLSLYVNGVSVGSFLNTSLLEVPARTVIGNSIPGGGLEHNGQIDYLSVWKGVQQTTDYLTTFDSAISAPGTFYTLGVEQAAAVSVTTGASRVVYDQTVPAVTTAIDIIGLNLPGDGHYVLELMAENSTATLGYPYLYVNGDTVLTNYYSQYIFAYGTTITANRPANTNIGALKGNTTLVSIVDIHVVNGYFRAYARANRDVPSLIELHDAAIAKTAPIGTLTQINLRLSAGGFSTNTRVRLIAMG